MSEINVNINITASKKVLDIFGGILAALAPSAPREEIEEVPAAPVVNPTQAAHSVPLDVTPAPVVPIASNPIPEVPTAAPQYTLEMISTAGASLIDAGKLDQLMALLGKYGVSSLTDLNPTHYGAVAADLRALGARI